MDTLNSDTKWYLAYEILYFETDDSPEGQPYLVWENLILIEASNPEEAYKKAMKHGYDNEHEVRIDGRKGHCRFKGLKDLVKIYDELEDGSEIEWREYEVDRAGLDALIKHKHDFHAFKLIPADED